MQSGVHAPGCIFFFRYDSSSQFRLSGVRTWCSNIPIARVTEGYILEQLHGVILAGGISSRMGFPKALMPLGTSFFLKEVYDRLVEAGVATVHIVVNPGLQTSLKPQLDRFSQAQFHANSDQARGQLYSLQLGLAAALATGARSALVALVDQPHVQLQTIQSLLSHASQQPTRVVVPRYEGHRGHPFLIPAELFAEFTQAAEDSTTRDILDRIAAQVASIEVTDPAVIHDIDSLADLAQAVTAPVEQSGTNPV